jgi:chromosomal replication initiator protein
MAFLDRFVQLAENRSAFEAVVRLASAANPPLLVLHGPPGTGKSHLVQALVERVTTDDPSKTAQVLAAAELGRTLGQPPLERQPVVREAIACDLLAIEDLQHLPMAAGDAIAHILDRRQRHRRITVMTAGRGPADLETSPRLASRLTGGLIVGIAPLNAASRRELAATVCRERKLKVTDEVVDWLARDPGGARPILGKVAQLEQIAKLHPPPLTLSIVESALATASDEYSLLDRLVALVGARFDVDAKSLRGPSRQRGIVWPRQVAMYVAREAGLSYPQIGAFFGGRDHTTVMHSCEKVALAAASDPRLTRELAELRNAAS